MAPDNSGPSCLLVFGASGTLGRAVVARAQAAGRFGAVAGCGFRHEPPGEPRFQFDVLDRDELAAIPDKLAKKNLKLSAVVNCVGATRDRLLLDASAEDWDEVVDLNLRSAFLIARTFIPVLLTQRSGHFVFVGSHAGAMGRAGQASYSAAKAGLAGLTQSLAREYGKRNIQANFVLPGFLEESPMVRKMSDEAKKRIAADNALGSPSAPDEVADFILHLLSMKKVSGQTFAIDSRILPS